MCCVVEQGDDKKKSKGKEDEDPDGEKLVQVYACA
jgi:hypothetical protein